MMSRGYDKSVGARGSDLSGSRRSGRYSGFLLCSDWDGTLTSDGRNVSEANLDAIARFESEGGIFTIASGRYPSYLDSMGIELSSYALLLNGNLVYDPIRISIPVGEPARAGSDYVSDTNRV